MKDIAQTLLISSNLVKLHANGLLGEQIIQNGRFVPNFEYGSVVDDLNETVEQFKQTLVYSDVTIRTDFDDVDQKYTSVLFDRKRLQ